MNQDELKPGTMKSVRSLLWHFIVVLNFMLACNHSFGQDHSEDPALSILKSSIEKILIDTNTPGAGIAIVTASGPVWVSGLGKANIEKNALRASHRRAAYAFKSYRTQFVTICSEIKMYPR